MQQIRIQKKVPRKRKDRHDVLPLDPRDPDVVRVKLAMRRETPAPIEQRAA